MQRIQVLLQKINELAQNKENPIVEVDLMLDYTRVLYADLLELRNNLAAQKLYVPKETPAPVQPQPQQQPQAQAAKMAVPAPPAPPPVAQVQPNETIAQNEVPVSTHTATKSVRNRIGINDKYQFISELFGNDKDAYEAAMDELDACDTYSKAYDWLKANTHRQNKWEDDHETVISFYATLHLLYNNQ